jgi:peptidoglycan/LPS O-acetylase OafA/YrhL
MGLLRFLLAISVAYGHNGGVAPILFFAFINPYYAVQAFFVISGFYMGMIYKKYVGIWPVFYVNRFMRLSVSFWIVALITLLLSRLRPDINFPVRNLAEMPVLAVISNLFLFGSDWTQFFTHDGNTINEWLLIPQAWSLGAELCFYLLVPFLAPLKTRLILVMIMASIIIRLIIIGTSQAFFPWQQRFFPAEIGFFLVGILSYRVYSWLAIQRWRLLPIYSLISLFIGVAMVIFVGHIPGAHVMTPWGSLLVAGLLFALLPSIFLISRNSKFDRWLGEFSYPIYLWHVFVIMFIFNPGAYFGEKVVAMSILLSLPLVLLVERPLERWRQTQVSTARNQVVSMMEAAT